MLYDNVYNIVIYQTCYVTFIYNMYYVSYYDNHVNTCLSLFSASGIL